MIFQRQSVFMTKIFPLAALLNIGNPVVAADKTVLGIDVSHYQTIRWDQVQDIPFAFAKATGVIGSTDPQFINNWYGMKEEGIIPGAYDFFYPDDDAAAQANYFLSVVGQLIKSGDLPPALDLECIKGSPGDEECTQGVTGEQLIEDISTWLTTVEQALGCKPIIYTDLSYANEYLGDHFASYPLWIAEYTSNLTPTMPTGWSTWTFWQYSDTETVSGVNGAVDTDRFNGSLKALNTFLKKNACQSTVAADNTVPGTVPGMDVSHYQTVRWDQVQDIRFSFAKATGGIDFTDPQFINNWYGMREEGIIPGAYDIFYPDDDAAAQANYFLSVVGQLIKSGGLPPALDLECVNGSPGDEECTQGVTGEQLIKDISTWLTTVEKALGCKPIIYTDRSYANKYLGDHFASYPLWIAEYTSNLTPTMPTGWSTWTFWQYSDTGTISGVNGAVDTDRFNGSLKALKTFIKKNSCQPAIVKKFCLGK
jgi:lysozyme